LPWEKWRGLRRDGTSGRWRASIRQKRSGCCSSP